MITAASNQLIKEAASFAGLAKSFKGLRRLFRAPKPQATFKGPRAPRPSVKPSAPPKPPDPPKVDTAASLARKAFMPGTALAAGVGIGAYGMNKLKTSNGVTPVSPPAQISGFGAYPYYMPQ